MTDAEFSADLARELEELVLGEGPETVAAFIAEPVQAAGGVIVPPRGYFAAVQRSPAPLRHPADCRRGCLWFRSHRPLVPHRDVRLAPRSDDPGQGHPSGLRALSACLVSSPSGTSSRKGTRSMACSDTATPIPPTRWRRPPP